jgi:hypothetical protein
MQDKWQAENLDVASCTCGAAVERRRRLAGYYSHQADQLETQKYPQRIDVAEWKDIVPSGVVVPGLSIAAPFPRYRRAAIELLGEEGKAFFEAIKTRLQGA